MWMYTRNASANENREEVHSREPIAERAPVVERTPRVEMADVRSMFTPTPVPVFRPAPPIVPPMEPIQAREPFRPARESVEPLMDRQGWWADESAGVVAVGTKPQTQCPHCDRFF